MVLRSYAFLVFTVVMTMFSNSVFCRIEATNNENSPDEHRSFQECMLYCLDTDLCCSCKESGKPLMNAAMINVLSDTCATSNLLKCTETLINSWVSKAERSGASWCTIHYKKKTELEFATCINRCSGKPLSRPLHRNFPYQKPELLTQFSELATYYYPDFNRVCSDQRTTSILCTDYRSNSFTATKELCRNGHLCGYHGENYYWCYTGRENWDYCCTGSCGYWESKPYKWCRAGSEWQYCK